MKKEMVDAELMEGLKELLSVWHVIKEYKKVTYLFQEGDTIEGVYIGNVQISKVTPDGRELTLRVCGRNQLVGEVAVFSSPSKYRPDAKAIENSVFAQVLTEDLEEALLAGVQLAAAFMKWMGIDQQKMHM